MASPRWISPLPITPRPRCATRLVNDAFYCAAVAGAVLIAVDLPHPTNLADEGQRVLFTFTGVGIGVPGEPAAKAHCRTGPTRTCSPGPRRLSSSASPSGDAASIPPSLAVTPSVDAAGPA